ncbi:hypothetical protein BFP70_14445 [Thioclava sp. SK-1]|uniref:hypothetical protein n=1 Tax=Thioclava sp. SK-1 TaxID=1889770 RepID=UPI000826CA44|nr:hypothetical protein [Thioclava sp. SK-1]OCX62053.1 hypothetical protein BFP70_14445 [Thioclava sp. SK-1]
MSAPNPSLATGQGLCLAQARLLIRPVRAAIELGAGADVLATGLRAVHHVNRHGTPDDFIAIAFPQMRMGRETMQPGNDLELLGSETSLAAFLACDGARTLHRRGMIEAHEISESYAEIGQGGAAYIRDRACEKYTPGWLRRSAARAERRGKPLGKQVKPRANDTKSLVLQHGDAVLHIREVLGVYSDAPLMVSTYGLSGAGAPAILPVYADALGEADDAA